MKVGVLLNENCPTFNNWKKWQGINESWHTSEMQCPSVLLDFYSQIVQITLWWPRGLTSPCRRISVKELPMCTEKIKQMQHVWLYIFSCRRFEDTFENAQWRKVKQMQPMWLYILRSKFIAETFEETQWRKVKQMQPMWIYIHKSKRFEETFENE